MNLDNISTFLSIVTTQSISKTSDRLFLSQSTVSQRLRVLEDELGVQLIQRTRGKRTVTLTPEGESFVQLAKKWLLLANETQQWKLHDSKLKLKIGSSDSVNTCIFPGLYHNLLRRDSPLILKVRSHWSTVILNDIDNYTLDMGFVLIPNSNENLIFEPLFKERLVVISNYNHCLPSLISPRDLDPLDEIYFYNGPDFKIWHDFWFDPAMKNPSTIDTVSLLQTVFSSDEFWSIVPISAARYISKTNDIQISELSKPAPERTCYKVKHRYPKQTSIKAIQIFENELKTFLSSNVFQFLTQ